MTEQKTETKVLVNMKINDLFKEFDNTKVRFFAEPNNKALPDSLQGEIWTTATANALLCALGMTIRTQAERRMVLASIADMLERMFPEQPEHNTNKDRLCEQGSMLSEEEKAKLGDVYADAASVNLGEITCN